MARKFDRYKADFVKALEKLVTDYMPDANQIVSLDYNVENDCEFVVVTFKSKSKKKFYVNFESGKDILIAFAMFLKNFDDYEWILPFPELIDQALKEQNK